MIGKYAQKYSILSLIKLTYLYANVFHCNVLIPSKYVDKLKMFIRHRKHNCSDT